MELSNRDIYIRGTKRRSGACHAPQLSSLNGSKRHILSFELGALVFFFFFLFTVFFVNSRVYFLPGPFSFKVLFRTPRALSVRKVVLS